MHNGISRVGTVSADLGECPLWDGAAGRLWFMDCRRGVVYRIDPEQADPAPDELIDVPPPAGSFAFNHDGRLVVALKESIALVDPASGSLTRLAQIDDSHPNLRLNDGTALADGSFLFGTMHPFRAEGEAPLGGLYRLFPDGRLRKLDTGFGVVNGPRVSSLDSRLYVCDSAARTIWTYAFDDDGGLADRRVFVTTGHLGSAPDGCCFDSDGGLWTALVHAGAVVRFAPDGRLDLRIDVPLAHPTSLCFGGPGLADLFVTSIRDSGRLRADGPLDGALLRVQGTAIGGRRGYVLPACRLAAP